MKILLVWPKQFEDTTAIPLGYTYLVPALRNAGHEIDVADFNFTDKVTTTRPDIVGVSVWSNNRRFAAEYLRRAIDLDPSILRIVGGPGAIAPGQALIDTANIIVTGEAEEGLVDFLAGRVPSDKPPELDDLALPDYHAIDFGQYLDHGYSYRTHGIRQAPIVATRGCPYACKFCAASILNGRKIRRHSIGYLKEVILGLIKDFDIRQIDIVDDNFTFDTDYVLEFCEMAIPLGLKFATPNGIRMERSTPEMFRLMKQAGWERIIIAPETGSPTMIKHMGKHLDLGIAHQIVDDVHAAGMAIEGFFIFGHPGETAETVGETRTFIMGLGLDAISIHVFQPIPGTPIAEELGIDPNLDVQGYTKAPLWIPENWSKDFWVEQYQSLFKAFEASRR